MPYKIKNKVVLGFKGLNFALKLITLQRGKIATNTIFINL